MHFQIIKDGYYDSIVADLRQSVPEFTTVFDEEDGVYPILGEFSEFLVKNISSFSIVNKSFDFINRALEEGNNKTEDVIVIQIFQPIYETKSLVEKARAHLRQKGLTVFDKFREIYDKDSSH